MKAINSICIHKSIPFEKSASTEKDWHRGHLLERKCFISNQDVKIKFSFADFSISSLRNISLLIYSPGVFCMALASRFSRVYNEFCV